MASLTDYQRDVLEAAFRMVGFSHMYNVIHAEYKMRELGTDVDDQTRIAEYKWVCQQLRKFMSSKYDQVLDHGGDLDGMKREVEYIVSNLNEYGSDRKGLVYAFLRDQWLMELWDAINALIGDDEKEDDDE